MAQPGKPKNRLKRTPPPRLLLQAQEVADVLGISQASFFRIQNDLLDRGVLRPVRMGKIVRYEYASLKRAVEKAARREEALV